MAKQIKDRYVHLPRRRLETILTLQSAWVPPPPLLAPASRQRSRQARPCSSKPRAGAAERLVCCVVLRLSLRSLG